MGLLVIVVGLWLSAGELLAALEPDPRIQLSEEQRKFITDHTPIRVGITPEWAPFSYFTPDGKGAGIDVDVLEIISQRTGLRFELIPGAPPWEEIWRMAKQGKVDLTTSTVQSADREKVFLFTTPYTKSSSVIVARGGDLRFLHLSLLSNAIVAQPRKHLISIAFTNRFPTASVVWFDTQTECFEAVTRGKADAAVADLYATTQYMNDHPQVRLGISGVIPEFEFPQRLAVRRDYPVLVDILNQALATISQKELDAITGNHLLFTLQGGRRVALLKKRLAYVVVGAAALAGIFVIWNYLIRKEMVTRCAAEAELREINQSLEIFSHSIAHDLRAPLRAISGLSEALQQDYGGKLDDVGQDYLRRISFAAERMENLVRDVLAYSQASRAEFKIENVTLKQVVNELLGEFPPEQRGYFHLVTELPTVQGHPALLAQCFANLFGNAIKFVPEERTPDIRIWSEQKGERVRIWVEDNGIGIAPEEQLRIFKLFQRGSHHYGGTGIGLAVVAKGMERMGGSFGVESQVNQGSRFWIELKSSS
ncbi:MAG: transporter substrate-binding domain-containing protein [Verrucomicrobia bacterium]|nr:transporter substrate-binding domain-containing protein [Verrucomicrobiota bacterium]